MNRWPAPPSSYFVDATLVQRLRFFRSFDPLPSDGHLLARPEGKHALIRQLRPYLHEVSVAVGIPTRIVPHQLRHTYASEMVRSGVTLPALMKLLGHSDPGMTIRYVDVASNDLQREFHLARSRPRHLTPQLRTTQVRAEESNSDCAHSQRCPGGRESRVSLLKNYSSGLAVKLSPTIGTKSCSQPPTLAPRFGVITCFGNGVR